MVLVWVGLFNLRKELAQMKLSINAPAVHYSYSIPVLYTLCEVLNEVPTLVLLLSPLTSTFWSTYDGLLALRFLLILIRSWSVRNVRLLNSSFLGILHFSVYFRVLFSLNGLFLRSRSQFVLARKIANFFSKITGEKKLGKVICPDPWKSGARNTTGTSINVVPLS